MSTTIQQCLYCRKIFGSISTLNRHITSHHTVKEMSERGRPEEREEVGNRKKSRSRSRSAYEDQEEEYYEGEISEAQQFFRATYPRLLKSQDPLKVFEGADDEVQTLLTEKYFKEKAKFLREKQEFEAREREFLKLDNVFQQILMRPQPTTTTSTATSSSNVGGIFGIFNNSQTSANP
jgi:hypothetical protein